jgi:hypothetical protein
MSYLRSFLQDYITDPCGSTPDGGLTLPLGIKDGRIFNLCITNGSGVSISGQTGFGKSVLLDHLVLSLAYKYHHGDLQFRFIDFKGLCFERFSNIPHTQGVYQTRDPEILLYILAVIERDSKERLELMGQKSFDDYNVSRIEDGYRPLSRNVVVMDETQALLSLDDPSPLVNRLIEVKKLAQSAGYHFIVCAQKGTLKTLGLEYSFEVALTLPEKGVADVDITGSGCLVRVAIPMVTNYDEEQVLLTICEREPESGHMPMLLSSVR